MLSHKPPGPSPFGRWGPSQWALCKGPRAAATLRAVREYNFDGLVGPTHNYGGLSPGNVAATTHAWQVSNPREAALQGLAKMRLVRSLGVGQALLPPQERPHLATLHQLGFRGSDEALLAAAASEAEQFYRVCTSASAMWTANAATVSPSSDTADGRVHFTPANLTAMLHRALEAPQTTRTLRALFSDRERFCVHEPLPGGGHLADEGAANHTRLAARPEGKGLHLFAWGRSSMAASGLAPRRFPARQTLEASQAIARRHGLAKDRTRFPQQSPDGIDAGAFHTDVLAVGQGNFLMVHEQAFVDLPAVLEELQSALDGALVVEVARERELPAVEAVGAYPFNSQLLPLEDGGLVLLAPTDAEQSALARAFLERVVAGKNPVREVRYLDLRQSMHNGGGPACLRLRVPLTDAERAAIPARVFLDDALEAELTAWVHKHYRDRLAPRDVLDPKLHRECMTALDELTGILRTGPLYDFQRTS